ncbi:ADP-heptose--lipooligosaccharide heptosyltransferase II [hydrothermal vent metagenome]|uniref:ADP-heptose--lipooligosaccharide heptosyltransferase II n=1 Tax=hydrothermal vent metagenome TaxID=652676 RepID=A0A3B1A5N2_9ZZZZ
MPLPFKHPPENICILRLSAIGDVCHTLPIIQTIQKHWPSTKLTWIIGKTEYPLVNEIQNINFIVFDKANGLKAYKDIRKQLKNTEFDALLHMQMSLRTSLISLLVNSKIKLGFDKQRAKDLQWLFSNTTIPYKEKQHVIDSFFGFTETLGITEHEYQWNIPVTRQTPLVDKTPYVVISPCSSMAYRNWTAEGYAAIADWLYDQHDMQVVLSGGHSVIEKEMADKITRQVKHPVLNLTAKTDLKQLLSLLKDAYCVISPDSGPAHIATAVNTPVIGLYACTNPERARPYLSKQWTVNRYPEAIQKKFHSGVEQVKWGKRVRDDWAMKLITVDDVTAKFNQLSKANPV